MLAALFSRCSLAQRRARGGLSIKVDAATVDTMIRGIAFSLGYTQQSSKNASTKTQTFWVSLRQRRCDGQWAFVVNGSPTQTAMANQAARAARLRSSPSPLLCLSCSCF